MATHTPPLQARVAQALAALAAKGRHRQLSAPVGIDFASNDYLQMADHPVLRETAARALMDGLPLGAGAARLLRGNHPVISDCETFFAQWLGAPRCLLVPSGYTANVLLLSTLPQRGDVILYDALIHASLRDGIRASDAKAFKFAHNDLQDLGRLLAQHQTAEQIFIVTESLFGMDGDFPPLLELLALAERHGAMLVVDEAHATGILGPGGRGLCAGLPRDHLISVHTGGKALGVAGGIIAARGDIIDYLINAARPFVYSTAPMPLQALALQTSAEILDAETWRREKLMALCRTADQQTRGRVGEQISPIFPIIIGADEAAVSAAQRLQSAGYDVRAIRPPTVPEGTARLRISINISQTEDDIRGLFSML